MRSGPTKMKKPAKNGYGHDVNNSSIPIFNNSSIHPLDSVATSGSVSTSFGGALAPTIQHQQGFIARRALGDITNAQTSSTNASSEIDYAHQSRKRKAESHNEDVEKPSDGKAKPRIRAKLSRPLNQLLAQLSSPGKSLYTYAFNPCTIFPSNSQQYLPPIASG